MTPAPAPLVVEPSSRSVARLKPAAMSESPRLVPGGLKSLSRQVRVRGPSRAIRSARGGSRHVRFAVALVG